MSPARFQADKSFPSECKPDNFHGEGLCRINILPFIVYATLFCAKDFPLTYCFVVDSFLKNVNDCGGIKNTSELHEFLDCDDLEPL